MAKENGLITEAMAEGEFWYSDGYADYIRHFLAGMGSVPEWSPPGENHLLRSSSVVRKVNCHLQDLSYSTFDENATEVLRLAFRPTWVTANGTPLRQRPGLSEPGWIFDAHTGVLRVRHEKAQNIVVNGSGAVANSESGLRPSPVSLQQSARAPRCLHGKLTAES